MHSIIFLFKKKCLEALDTLAKKLSMKLSVHFFDDRIIFFFNHLSFQFHGRGEVSLHQLTIPQG
jgi:transcriptional regulatory protein LevR